ncbi:MAG: 8-hydroxy-5-deazaflavin:NADPH oxidoreductase [Actinomycetota bacterium]|jgi:NADPH-dependent F420 reductase|nr:8-hydroxy-5-deazaflavin:NADPH oxidoreductase [Actinomycetota bacterium]
MSVEHVAIIGGTGDLGFALATRWAKAGVHVTIGSREKAKAEAAVEKLKAIVPDANADGLDNPAAASSTNVVVIAVPFSGFVPIYRAIADSLQESAVVIDATVPVEASVGGKATHVFGVWEGSAAQLGLAFLPKGTKMCAAFHTLSASAVSDLESKLDGDILVCGSKQGKGIVKELIELMPSLRFVDAGPLENARIIEPITALLIGINHRYGTDRAGIAITGID